MNEEITQKVFDTYCALAKAQAILVKYETESAMEQLRLHTCLKEAECAYLEANAERLKELDRLAQCRDALEAARERRLAAAAGET